jgi:hypothetical protein
MNGAGIRQRIAAALAAFGSRPLPEAASDLFASLGYASERRLQFPSLAACLNEFDKAGKAAKLFPEAASQPCGAAVVVQQLTSEEIAAGSSGQLQIFDRTGADLRQFESYLFFAVPLPEGAYTRTALADRARALNALFAQPVLVLFHHGQAISLAITYRRTSKRDQTRDVIQRKVTLIKDIACAQPHPGHLAILEDFSLPALSKARQRDIQNFSDLDDAWRESLSAQLLNQQFYDEIANWYFWAREHAQFPKDAVLDADGKPSLPLIRLLTRLIFCWFLREKTHPQTGASLVPTDLFDPPRINELIKDASPNACTYYGAILQNLFFATLNTEMDAPGKPGRRFLREGDTEDHIVSAVWRYADQLRSRETFEKLFRRIPFLNGGLFECLDEPILDDNGRKIGEKRVDGFSSKPSKQAKVPNFLFYGPDQTADLSEAYGDSTRSRVTVRPLLEIFRRYKFTLAENTPIEEEVALDPELLGHVFENLLAAYNPETGTIARKATGSFYTPRVVVDWMVDEALVAYLESALAPSGASKASPSPQPDQGQKAGVRDQSPTEQKLRGLLSWDGAEHDFSDHEVEILIDSIHSLKALDPACGSGAFPMGLLQKLVLILRKLDPANQRWKARQTSAAEAIDSAPAREAALNAIERAFARDNDDYGRKLYLIENCLYGVDIQPVAVQIAKLRFFIALVVDQPISPAEDNYGILALPNLETKIVAANTLMGLKRGQLLLGSNRVRELERKLQQVRHDYFTARRYQDKKTLRTKDLDLCRQLATALAESGECTAYDAKRLAEWNPYDTNTPAAFFDPGWMFGLAAGRRRAAASARATMRGNFADLINQSPGQMEIGAPSDDGSSAGFDLLIGNPPYVRQEELKNVLVRDSEGRDRPLKEVLKDQYECYTGTADLYVYFFERSFQLLRTGGVLSFITSNKYFRAAYGERLRTYLLYSAHPRAMLDFGDAPLFTAIAYPCILVAQKARNVPKNGLPSPKEIQMEDRLKQLVHDLDRKIRALTWRPGPPLREFPVVFEEEAFSLAQRDLRPSGWKFESGEVPGLRRRLEAAATPLGHYTNELVFNGIKSGHKNAFTLTLQKRDCLIAQDPNSKEVLKPLLKGRDIKRWRVEPTSRWLLYIPWHFPLGDDAVVDPAGMAAETAFKRRFPKIHAYLSQFRDELERRDQSEIGIRYEWFCLSRPRPEAASFFDRPKIVFPDIAAAPCFAWDDGGHAVENTAYMIPGRKWLLAVLNSPPVFWYCRQISNTIRGGFVRFIRQYVEQIPIPNASPDQQQWCERLVEALLWLNRPGAGVKTGGAPVSLMTAYFQQWVNGLVYELFFPGELHDRRLHLFDETARLGVPTLDKLSESQKLSRLKGLFEQAYDTGAAVRSTLFSLRSLEVVRTIEEGSKEGERQLTEEVE